MFALIKRKTSLSFVLVAFLATSIIISPTTISAASSTLIELTGSRWNTFPLKVLVDMNQWSKPDYALAVRDAVDIWIRSIWTYSVRFNDTTLGNIGYTFHLSNINATDRYDVFITFTANEFYSDVIGLTTFKWNPITHSPLPPIIINITTYSGTASRHLVKTVAMHEFGHSLGLGHASSKNTQDGPELMYFQTPNERTVYPSTLDLYALVVLYQGNFSNSVQLPTSMPYEMVRPATSNLPNMEPDLIQTSEDNVFRLISEALSENMRNIWENERHYLVILALFLVVYFFASALGKEQHARDIRLSTGVSVQKY